MPYVGANGARNPMQIVTCPHCGTAVAGAANCPNGACGLPLQQPFVAVFEIGQGNCNALVGADGRVLAMFDIGYSTAGTRQPSPAFRPCLCDRPLIILSHWDLDHINLVRYMPELFTLTWIVPQQAVAAFAATQQARVRQAGGRLWVWPALAVGQARHMTFPWGYVERCTANAGTNGSGLATFVCVRDSPANPPAVNNPAVRPALRPDPIGAPARRAQKALAKVAAAIPARVPVAERAAVLPLANVLASTFAASQPLPRHVHMSPGACAAAAVSAALGAVRGLNAAAITVQLTAEHALEALLAHNAGWHGTTLLELGRAAYDAHRRGTMKRKVHAASARLTWHGAIDATLTPWIGVAALSPQLAVPPIREGHAPLHAQERFILLNGDADFRFVPSASRVRRPGVVGLTAMHHGSVYEDQHALAGGLIPWAPGSRAARLVHRLRVSPRLGRRSAIGLITEAAFHLMRRGGRHKLRRILRVATSRAARAAAAAVLALEAAYPGAVSGGAVPRVKLALIAAGAAAAALRFQDARMVGVTAALAATVQNVALQTDGHPLEGVIDLVGAAFKGRYAGHHLSAASLKEAAHGAIDGHLLIQHVRNIIEESINAGVQPLTGANASGNAVTAYAKLWNDRAQGLANAARVPYRNRTALDPNDQNALNDLTDGTVSAVLASRHGLYRRHSIKRAARAALMAVWPAGPAPNALQHRAQFEAVRRATRRRYTLFGPAPANADDTAQLAAQLAAECAAAHVAGLRPDVLRGMLESSFTPAASAGASRAATMPRQEGRVAYSYGVDSGDSSHEFETVVAGNVGHPHPLALTKYEGRGWTMRRNTSRRADHFGPQGDLDTAHRRGHVALAWNGARDRPLPPASFARACASCGKRMLFQQ